MKAGKTYYLRFKSALKKLDAELELDYGRRPEGSHSKLSTFRDGAKILWMFAMLMKETRPFTFFGAISGTELGVLLVGMVQPILVVLIVALILIAAMCYGPLAALMVELFPTRIRYTSMSLPYHIGNGWFGGFLPTVSFALVVYTGDIFYGLWYPVVVTGVSLIVGLFCLKETRHVDIEKN